MLDAKEQKDPQLLINHVNDETEYRVGFFRFTEHRIFCHWIVFDKSAGKLRDLKFANQG